MVADVVVVEAVEEEVAAVAVDAVGLDVVVAGDDALGTSKISKKIKINYKANTFTTLKLDGLHRINHKALSTARNLFRALFFPLLLSYTIVLDGGKRKEKAIDWARLSPHAMSRHNLIGSWRTILY